MLCEYGCGQEAKYQLKNGKWCCSKFISQCPRIRLKNSNSLKKLYIDGKKNCDHFNGKRSKNKKGKTFLSSKSITHNKYEFDDIFSKNSKTKASRAKDLIIKENLKEYKCENCGNTGLWKGKKLNLHLDHINGDNKDNRLENLRFLCPNCHAQTKTYCGKNVNRTGNFINQIEEDKLIICLKNNKTITGAIEEYNSLYNKELRVYGSLYNYIKKLIIKNNCILGENFLNYEIQEKRNKQLLKEQEKEKKRLLKLEKEKNKKNDKIKKQHDIALKINALIDSNIDFSKYGWVQQASEIIHIGPQKTRAWIERNYPKLLEKAFSRKFNATKDF